MTHAKNILAQLTIAEREGVISEEELAERERELLDEEDEEQDAPGPADVRIGRST